jgi:hypothetical protein
VNLLGYCASVRVVVSGTDKDRILRNTVIADECERKLFRY